MRRPLRHGRAACRWRRGAIGLLLTATVLVSLGIGLGGGLARGAADAPLAAHPDAFGAPAPGHAPAALTGRHGFAIVPGGGDSRQRGGQLVEPGGPGLAGSATGQQSGTSVATREPRQPLGRGLLAARAPPARTV
jgi:hypothetical protein